MFFFHILDHFNSAHYYLSVYYKKNTYETKKWIRQNRALKRKMGSTIYNKKQVVLSTSVE